MSYILGAVTLPNPKKFTREFVETTAENLLINGTSTKKVENRKEIFTLEFSNLTVAQVNSIMSEYEMNLIRQFTVTETNLAISATDVLINVKDREYQQSGRDYRENITLVLTEVL
jgi:hypothetical protein